MAEKLASIFGTEKDKVNCPFYHKIGACRHGERCSRLHNKPTMSQTILLKNMYQNPAVHLLAVDGSALEFDEKDAMKHFEEFYEDVFLELSSFGEVEEMNVCDNIGDHLVGNVYSKFINEEDADKALKTLNGRFYAGRPIIAEFSPVTDFREARCRQFDNGECTRGGYCNFMHLKEISRELSRKLYGANRKSSSFKRRSRSWSPKGRDDNRRDDRREDRPRYTGRYVEDRRDDRHDYRNNRDDRRDDYRGRERDDRRDDRRDERRDDRNDYRRGDKDDRRERERREKSPRADERRKSPSPKQQLPPVREDPDQQ